MRQSFLASQSACTYDIDLKPAERQCHKYYGVTYGKAVSKSAASLRCAVPLQQKKTGLPRNSADRFVLRKINLSP